MTPSMAAKVMTSLFMEIEMMISLMVVRVMTLYLEAKVMTSSNLRNTNKSLIDSEKQEFDRLNELATT